MDRTGIFAGDDPFTLAQNWLDEAQKAEPNDPNAIALASVDETGMPNIRMVLLKDIEPMPVGGFLFYTNYTSVKGQEILTGGKAGFVMHWKSLRRQIRVRGLTEREEGAKADAYYTSRNLQSRIGAWASHQSQPLSSRMALMAEVAKITALKGPNPPRPPFWGGIRIRPLEIEFWADGNFRLHDRFRWSRPEVDHPWSVTRLSP